MMAEGYEELISTLKSMGQAPKVKSPQELKAWMKEFLKEETEEVKPKDLSSYVNPPRLTFFSGKDKPGSGETTYDLWRHELVCLVDEKTHRPEAIAQAIRRSLKGDAGKVVMRLGPHAEIGQILEKMDSVFGVVEEKESVMREFYNATQKEDEDVTTWSFRLEDISEKAIQINKVKRPEADEMIHDILWKGLRPDLKAISHYEKEKYTTFDALRVALRKIEKDNLLDQPSKPVKGTSKKAVAKTDEDEEDQNMKGILKQITSRLDRLETGWQPTQYDFRGRGRGGYRPNYRGGYRGNRYRGNNRGRGYNTGSHQQQQTFPPITCRRCGQEGHIARGCRVNLDSTQTQQQQLNSKESTPRSRR